MADETLRTSDERRAHWDGRYRDVGADAVSWFEAEPRLSLALFDIVAVAPTDSVVDIGGGASPLADRLRARGHVDVTVVDVSAEGLATARAAHRQPDAVDWIEADLLTWDPQRTFDVWHDRAVFHFLVVDDDCDAYRRLLHRSVCPGGAVVIATFADDGPTHCSGLPVRRRSPGELSDALGDDLHVVAAGRYLHTTPTGAVQPFSFVAARRPV